MSKRLFRIGVMAACVAGTATFLAAQTHDGLDLGALRKEAKSLRDEVGDFANEVRTRGDEAREDALAAGEMAEANARRAAELVTGEPPAGPIDFDEMLSSVEQTRGGGPLARKGPLFIAFASTSMPDASLRQLIRDVSAAGGITVFRGFPENDAKLLTGALTKVIDKGQSTANIGIDPRLFRAFNIEAVPSYVVTANEVELCKGFSCVSKVPLHDRLAGNVTVSFALETIAGGGGPGSVAARTYLRKMDAKEARPGGKVAQ